LLLVLSSYRNPIRLPQRPHVVYCLPLRRFLFLLFFFTAAATTELYTLSLHDALPISSDGGAGDHQVPEESVPSARRNRAPVFLRDRKSTRLNSSHGSISYAVFCLKKKKNKTKNTAPRKTRAIKVSDLLYVQ